jgi:hypothetical protein
MNYALILSGQPVFYKECYESLRFFLNRGIEDKVFSHIWWDKNYVNKPYKLHFKDIIKDENLDKLFIENYRIDKFISEPHKSFNLDFCNKFNYSTWQNQSLNYYRIMTPIVLYGLLSQTYSLYKSCLLANQFAKYDFIIKSRPDIVYTKPVNPIIEKLNFSENKIYFQSSMNGGHVYAGEFPNKPCDWFFVGNPKVVEAFCKDWYELIRTEYTNGIIHINDFVKIVCNKNNIEIELVDFGALIYKQVSDFYNKYLIEPTFYINDFDFNISKPKNPDLWPYWIENVDFKHYNNIK